MWLTFLDNFNGRAFFSVEPLGKLPLHLNYIQMPRHLKVIVRYLVGIGLAVPFRMHGTVSTSLSSSFFPIVLAAHIWGSSMTNRCVLFFTDNAALVDIINKQTSKHKLVMVLLRDLVLSCLCYNILFRRRHVPGRQNSQADYISRFQVESFKVIAPQADELQTPVPANLLPESWSLI